MQQFGTASKRNESEWTQRKKIVDEHWRETRFGILSCCIAANQIPDLVARCDSCDGIAARIKCISCFKFLCHVCDQAIHCQQPFHDRQVWVKGYYEGIGNRNIVLFDGKLGTAGKTIFVHVGFSSLEGEHDYCNSIFTSQKYTIHYFNGVQTIVATKILLYKLKRSSAICN